MFTRLELVYRHFEGQVVIQLVVTSQRHIDFVKEINLCCVPCSSMTFLTKKFDYLILLIFFFANEGEMEKKLLTNHTVDKYIRKKENIRYAHNIIS